MFRVKYNNLSKVQVGNRVSVGKYASAESIGTVTKVETKKAEDGTEFIMSHLLFLHDLPNFSSQLIMAGDKEQLEKVAENMNHLFGLNGRSAELEAEVVKNNEKSTKPKKLKLQYLDTCYSDYFQGFNGTTLIAFHHNGQTMGEMIESLRENANNEYHEANVYEAIDEYAVRYFDSLDKPCIAESCYDENEDYDETMIHYFGLVSQDD